MTTEDQPVDEALLRGDEDEAEPTEELIEEPAAPAEEIQQEDAQAEDRREDVIPKARFNEVNEERKALRAELERLQQEQQQREAEVERVDIRALRREATAALLEGDSDKHDELQERIDNEILRQAEENATYRITQQTEANAFKQRAAELTADYPVLNPKTGDPEAIELVVELRDSYIGKGMGMVEALERAVAKVAPRFQQDQPATDDADARKLAAVKRGATDSNRIPPQGGGVGNRALPPATTREPTQSEWDAMTPAQREKILAAA